MNQLEIHNASKRFGNKIILDKVSISFKKGEIIGLFGRNGSGKSTLLQGIMGTLKMDTLHLKLDGSLIKPSQVIPKQVIGYLPQDSFLPKEMRVREIIAMMFPGGEEQDAIFYAEGVGRFDHNKVGKISAGERKYLEFLLLCHLQHPFLLLDEPFSMVEPRFIELIKKLLLSLKSSKGFIITDHYYLDVMQVSDRIFVLKDGKLVKVENEQDLAKHQYLKDRNQ